MSPRGVWTAILIAMAILAAFVYWVMRERGPAGPPPPASSSLYEPLEFQCNGEDALSVSVTVDPRQTMKVRGVFRIADDSALAEARRSSLLLYVVDAREVIHQSANLDKEVDSRRLSVISFACESTAPVKPGGYAIRVVAIDGDGEAATICSGSIIVR